MTTSQLPASSALLAAKSRLGMVRVATAATLACLLIAALATAPASLAPDGRVTLGVFGLAIIAWSVLRLDEMPVAVGAAIALVMLGGTSSARFFAGLGDDLIWLLIGAFVLAEVLCRSGVAERLVLRSVSASANVSGLLWRLCVVIAATAFVVPSTSGRAALLLPVFLALARAIAQPTVTRALALLFPSVILLSACASLLGAAAHLIAVDVLAGMGLPPIGFLQWAVLGVPFAALSCVAATLLILYTVLPPSHRRAALALPAPDTAPLHRKQRAAIAVTGCTVSLWVGSTWLDLDATLIALLGALAATCKPLTGVAMKDALKGVEWNLILFLAATGVMGQALLDSGAARWLATQSFALVPPALLANPLASVLVAGAIAMVSHLVITSRSARAAVLIPSVALPLAAHGANPAALVFLVTVASGYCQTTLVSAKPVALYARLDEPTYGDGDLWRLSLRLMPVFAALLVVFAVWLWPALGLPLRTGS